MKIQTITINQLAEILAGIKGATPVTISALTDTKARKTGNPFDQILKLNRINGMTGANYEASVNRQLVREGKEDGFISSARAWGDRTSAALVTKEDGKQYLAIHIQNAGHPIFFGRTKDGLKSVAKDTIAAFLPDHKKPASQGTDKEIVYRNYSLSSIAALSIGGKRYRVRS